MEKAGGADEHIRHIGVALGGFEVPASVGKPRCRDLLVEADEFLEAAIVRDLFDVGPDLLGRRIFARPVVVGLERKLVLPRQHIDKEAGKLFVAPGSATSAAFS